MPMSRDKGRTPLWASIAEDLRQAVLSGQYQAGEKLPTEAELSQRFGVNRHTVRHALAHLIEDGILISRRGAGTFVLTQPTDYAIGKRVRFSDNVAASGRTPDRRFTAIETRLADTEERTALSLDADARVHTCHGISLADGMPIATFVSVFPADPLPGLCSYLAQETSITKALRSCGVVDYTRQSTRISARAANATQALQLQVQQGAPLILSLAVNVDTGGTPIEYGRTWFVGDRVTLTLDGAG